MKICPVCQAKAFDDALVCYGCLHPFEEGQETECCAKPVRRSAPKHQPKEQPPEFCIRLSPAVDKEGGIRWDCSVEVDNDFQKTLVCQHAL